MPALNQDAILDRYFLEHRAKLLDLAAFLDRADRAPATHDNPPDSTDKNSSDEDFRLAAMRGAIAMLLDQQPDRTARILDLLSDTSELPLDKAPMTPVNGAAPLAEI